MSSTDFQSGREALAARLRELRAEAGLNGKELARRLGWHPSKVSRLQSGKRWDYEPATWAELLRHAGFSDVTAEVIAPPAGKRTGTLLVRGVRAR
ncbi:helix-turn-helix domain-containing protein [Streptomyces sp. NPDC014861]|uniref:helix-turn-helix domain-containing protein n=1 Tax=Streptomyces sp. NPDC014861 TaxID=3364923 RepID=UPI0036FB2117